MGRVDRRHLRPLDWTWRDKAHRVRRAAGLLQRLRRKHPEQHPHGFPFAIVVDVLDTKGQQYAAGRDFEVAASVDDECFAPLETSTRTIAKATKGRFD